MLVDAVWPRRSAMRGFYAELNGTNRDLLTQYRVRRRNVQELTGTARFVNLAIQQAANLRSTSCACSHSLTYSLTHTHTLTDSHIH